jgi:putative inorganic carbon (hco3(-)) transporter
MIRAPADPGAKRDPQFRAHTCVPAAPDAAGIAERLLLGGVFLLPLVCWPGLERPFSTPKTWLLGLMCLGVALHLLLRKWKPPAAEPARDWPWLIWFATLGLSGLAAPYVSLQTLLLTVLPVPLYWAIRQGNLPAERVRSAILLGSAAESAIVLLQYAYLDPFRGLGWQPEAFSSARMRVYGTLGNPDFVAAWLCATLPLYVGSPTRKPKSMAAYASAAAALLQLGAIFATGSRVFLLTLPAAAAVLVLRRRRFSKWLLAGLPVAAALLWFSPGRPLATTVEGRLYLARVTAGHWQEIPLLGNGPGGFQLQFERWQVEWLRQYGHDQAAARYAGPTEHAHNDYLELWVDYGPVGLVAFLGLCAWLMAQAWRLRPNGASALNAGAWSGLGGLLVIACVDFPLHRPAEWGLFWLFLGLLGRSSSVQCPADERIERKRRIAEC